MKITAGNSWIDYGTQSETLLRNLVLTEVVNADLSYEKPILINDFRELQACFGKDFTEYEYLEFLLNLGNITLYLFRPTLCDIGLDIAEGYYFLEDISPQTESSISLLRNVENLLSDENLLVRQEKNPNILYKVLTETGPFRDAESNCLFSYYRFKESYDAFLEELDIPITSRSNRNRDRLSVGENEAYCSYPLLDDPIVEESDRHLVSISELTEKFSSFDEFSDKVNYDITVGSNILLEFGELKDEDLKCVDFILVEGGWETKILLTNYFAIPRDSGLETLADGKIYEYDYYFYRPAEHFYDIEILSCPNDDFTAKVDMITPTGNIYYFDSVAQLKQLLGLRSDENQKKFKLGDEIYLSFPCNMPETFNYYSDDLENQKDIYETYVKPCELYRFESKTIGTGGDDGEIEVILEESELYKDIYTLTVLRFDYEETFEGSLTSAVGEERLDELVSRESKLVRFEILVEDEPENGWVLGDWTLSGGMYENAENWNYQYSLDQLTDNNEFTDFILVPEKTGLSDYQILEATKKCNCQALIVNQGNDLDTNLVKDDPENRLIYFFGNFFYGDDLEWRPGYDLFLRGLFQNNYLPQTSEVLYPVLKEDLNEEYNDKILELEYKSNVLKSNDHSYFYDMYYPGDDPETFPLVRFVISRVSRELERWKWRIIGEKMNNPTIRKSFERTLTKISEDFTIIRSIQVISFELNKLTQTIQANILTKMSDLISEDVSFDIILNYNKNQT
jgi:hypothetical protein